MIARGFLVLPVPAILAGCLASPDPPSCRTPRALEELNSSAEEGGPWLSPDRREMFFSSTRGGSGHRLMHASREALDEQFTDIVPVAGLAVDGATRDPFLETDGMTLWFSHLEQNGEAILYRARRETLYSAQFGPAERTEIAGTHPSLTEDGRTLVFSALDATPRKAIYRAQRTDEASVFGPRDELDKLRGSGVLLTAHLRSPTISAEGNRLVFAASFNDAEPFTIYESDLIGGAFEPGVAEADAATDPAANDEDPALHLFGETLVFASDRESPGHLDLFIACE